MIRNLVWWRCAMSEAEHMVEAECAVASNQAMIAEKPAGRVADNDIGGRSGALANLRVEELVIAEESRTRARNGDVLAGDLGARVVVQNQIGRAFGMPRSRRWIDQVAERVVGRVAESQKQAGRQA